MAAGVPPPRPPARRRRPQAVEAGPAAGWWPQLRAWRYWELISISITVTTAFLLRLHDDTRAPLITDNADEFQFTWLGLNLIRIHDPYTWSAYPGYPSYTPFHAFGGVFPMVHHYMDHPPLFGLVMGGFVWLLGDRQMTDVTAEQIRFLPVVFSTLTVLLVYILGRGLVGRLPALAGALLLATAPGAVLLGRQAEPEALQAPLMLAALILSRRLAEGRGHRGDVAGLLLIAVSAPLMKVPGVAVGGTCGVILAVAGRWRLAVAAVAAAGAGVALFALYGWAIDWAQFVREWGVQTSNRVGVMAAFDFITDSSGVNRRLRDGWWVLGWIGLGLWLVAPRGRRNLFLAWPLAAYAATILVMAGERQTEQYGWYKVIIYPQVYLAAGCLAWSAVAQPSLGRMAILLVLGGATAVNWLGPGGTTWVPNPVLLVLLLAVLLLPAGAAAWRPGNRDLAGFARAAGAVTLAVLVASNLAETLRLDQIFYRL